MSESIDKATAALRACMQRYGIEIMVAGTFASDEFDRLYLAWIQVRWDAGDAWVRSVWCARP